MAKVISILVLSSVLLLGLSGQQAREDYCDSLKPFVGAWKFTTLVTGAIKKGAIGAQGHYTMRGKIDWRSGGRCILMIEIDKTGYGKKRLKPRNILLGKSEGSTGHDTWGASTIKVPMVMRNAKGTSLNVTFYLATRKGKLTGHWHYDGRDAASTGMEGGLIGKKNARSQPKIRNEKALPKAVRCLLDHCDRFKDEYGCGTAYMNCGVE